MTRKPKHKSGLTEMRCFGGPCDGAVTYFMENAPFELVVKQDLAIYKYNKGSGLADFIGMRQHISGADEECVRDN